MFPLESTLVGVKGPRWGNVGGGSGSGSGGGSGGGGLRRGSSCRPGMLVQLLVCRLKTPVVRSLDGVAVGASVAV